MRERDVERVLTRGVNDLGGIALKLAPTMAGCPDRLLLLPGGRSLMVEVKTGIGRTSAIQRYWHGVALGLGHEVVVVYGLDDVRDLLQTLSKELETTHG